MKLQLFIFCIFLCTTLLHGSSTQESVDAKKKAYIVYMGEALQSKSQAENVHHNLLAQVTGDEEIARRSKIHSYGKSINAFVAHLAPEEAQKLQDNENVVSVFPSTMRKLHTTRSWDFLGIPLSVKRNHQKESDIIVGVMDTGIYMGAPSFDDKGFGPPPSKWKGQCQEGTNFTGCNNKVIGARAYNLDHLNHEPDASPVDDIGHGSHTASTISGVNVPGANLYGLGKGTARGGVPSARIAVYKVCYEDGCSDMNILAAFDDAIDDGVDMLSISLGGETADYMRDVIAIGSYHATKKGILTSCSAGNSGIIYGSVSNVAPWIFTVGASGMDRQFRAPVLLTEGMKTSGISINTFKVNNRLYPLTSGVKAARNNITNGGSALLCDPDTLDEAKVKGKIIFCRGSRGQDTTIRDLGGFGVIMSTAHDLDTGFTFVIPATIVDIETGDAIDNHINSTKYPQAVILKSKEVKVASPFTASFSSRGPNLISPSVLKPDVVAPGVDILAAFTKSVSLTGDIDDPRFNFYNIISGTSMSCPHVSGAAAYVKSFHPDWSPSVIKSALMTTASAMKVGDETAELAYGSGQIDPVRALQPGLVYETFEEDYIRFLCSEGYKGDALRIVTGGAFDCSKIDKPKGSDALNYPSMVLFQQNINASISAVFYRTVTNVGLAKSTYKATIKTSKGLNIRVSPTILKFDRVGQRKSFKVKLSGPPLKKLYAGVSGFLEWNDSVHRVRTPIMVHTYMFGFDE